MAFSKSEERMLFVMEAALKRALTSSDTVRRKGGKSTTGGKLSHELEADTDVERNMFLVTSPIID
jgi:hypothetical protein